MITRLCIVILSLGFITPPYALSLPQSKSTFTCRINEKSGYNLQFLNGRGQIIKTIRASTSERKKGSIHFFHLIKVHGCQQGRYAYTVDWHTQCDTSDDEGCGSVGSLTHPATISIYDASGHAIFHLKRIIQADTEDNLQTSDDDEMGVFVTTNGITGIRPDGQIYEVPINRPFFVTTIFLSPNGSYAAVGSGETGISWLMINLRSSQIESYTGLGDPDISDQGDFRFYTDRARYSPESHPGKFTGEFHFNSQK